MTAILRKFGLLSVIAAIFAAGPVAATEVGKKLPAHLIVEDSASMFSAEAIEKAKRVIADSKGSDGREVHVETYSKLSESDQKKYDAAKTKETKETFWKDWVLNKAKGDKGVIIAISRSPGHVEVLTSEKMGKFVTADDRKEVRKILLTSFGAAADAKKAGKSDAEQMEIRDKGLVSAMDYVGRRLPPDFGTQASTSQSAPTSATAEKAEKAGGSNIMTYVCIGIAVLLGLWLVMGVVRAFSGGGGGGGMGGGGGGMGGGGGGGGFMSSMLGGMFGAAAGMWMYDQFSGGHSNHAYGNDSGNTGGGGTGNEAVTDDGTFREDNSTGGDFDGGGDAGGGGGGDMGGGGDF